MSSFQVASSFPFANPDPAKPWIDLKFPSLTAAALLEAQHKNAAAVGNANQAAFDGLKTLVQRQGFLLAASADTYTRVTSDFLAAESFEERATKQVDATRDAYVSTVARFRELSEIVIEANVMAIGIVNARIIEAFGELRALFAPPVAATAAASAAPASALAAPAAVLEEVAAVETAIFPVEPDPTTVTAASTIAPEAAEPEAEAVAAPTTPPETAEPEVEVTATAAPMPPPRAAAPAARAVVNPARTTAPKTAAPTAKAAVSPARTAASKTPPLRPPRRPTSRS